MVGVLVSLSTVRFVFFYFWVFFFFFLTFWGTGTYVQPLGIIDTTNGKQPPTWSCFVDGKSVPVNPVTDSNFYHSNADLCEASDLNPGEHVLEVNITAPIGGSGSYSFGLDWIAYTPLQLAPIDETRILYVPNVDSNITIGAGWDTVGIASSTNTSGAQMVFTFTGELYIQFSLPPVHLAEYIGIGIQGLGYSPQNALSNPKGATYTIDNGSPVSFDIPASSTTPLYNVILFDVRNLSLDTHQLVVTFTGDPTKQPLEIDHFFVFNPPRNVSDAAAANSAQTSATGVAPGGSSETAVSTDSSSSPPTGAIAGGVIGGLVFLSILALFYYKQRRRRRRGTDPNAYEKHVVDPDSTTPTPFVVSGIQDSEWVSSPAFTSSARRTTKDSLGVSQGQGQGVYLGSDGVTEISEESPSSGVSGSDPGASPKNQTALTVPLRRDAENVEPVVERRAMDSGFRNRESALLPPVYTEA